MWEEIWVEWRGGGERKDEKIFEDSNPPRAKEFEINDAGMRECIYFDLGDDTVFKAIDA